MDARRSPWTTITYAIVAKGQVCCENSAWVPRHVAPRFPLCPTMQLRVKAWEFTNLGDV